MAKKQASYFFSIVRVVATELVARLVREREDDDHRHDDDD
jgi:hypothetical protein